MLVYSKRNKTDQILRYLVFLNINYDFFSLSFARNYAVVWRRMEKISWLDKVTNEQVLRRVNEDRQTVNSVWQTKHRWMAMFRDTMDFCMKILLKAE